MDKDIQNKIADKLASIEEGYSEAMLNGRRYRVSLRRLANGKINSFQAQELGGNDYISLNFYDLDNGTALLKPCEMPAQKVIDFIVSMEPNIK